MLYIKFKGLRVQKRIWDLDSINPLTLTIVQISQLPEDVAIVRKTENVDADDAFKASAP